MRTAEKPCIRRPTATWTTCRCADCAPAMRRLRKQVRNGIVPPAARSAEAWAALDRMLAAGLTIPAIAAASGVSESTLHHGSVQRTRGEHSWSRHNAEKLIAVEGKIAGRGTSPYVRHIGAQRRLRALTTRGWSMQALVDAAVARGHAPVASGTLEKIRRGDCTRWIKAANHEWITAVYAEMWNATPPPGNGTGMALASSARKGWAPPAAWDDDTIDDPNAQPYESMPVDLDEVAVTQCAEGRRHALDLTVAEREAAVRILHRAGMSDRQIAVRMQTTDRTVFRIRKRLGLPANVDNIGVNHQVAG